MSEKPQTIKIDDVEYVRKDTAQAMAPAVDGMKCVIIRSVHSGVHFGYLKEETYTSAGKVVKLVNSRRVWQWYGAASISQLAIDGSSRPNDCKIPAAVAEIEVVNVIETIELTEKAKLNLYSIKEWKA